MRMQVPGAAHEIVESWVGADVMMGGPTRALDGRALMLLESAVLNAPRSPSEHPGAWPRFARYGGSD